MMKYNIILSHIMIIFPLLLFLK